MIVLDRCHDLAVHHDIKTGVVVLEYASEGRVVSTGAPYTNRYISVLTITDRKVSHWRDYLDPWRSSTRSDGRHIDGHQGSASQGWSSMEPSASNRWQPLAKGSQRGR